MNVQGAFTTVASFTSPWEAHIARGRLEAEGIPAFVAHEHHVWANWPLSQALGGVKVQVPSDFAVEAAELMAAHLNGVFEADLTDDPMPSEDQCPHCGAAHVESRFSVPKLVLAGLSLLIAVAFPPRREMHKCAECGRRWRY